MTTVKEAWQRIGPFEAVGLLIFGFALAMVFGGAVDGIALIILLVLAYFAWMARGTLIQARRFRPVEPPKTWLITLLANLALMALGIGSFGWYLAGGGSRTWVPFLFFIAGVIALRQWRRGVTKKLYAWRTPALILLQQGDYKRLIKELEDEAKAGHPDKLAMVALAYIELNKWDKADHLLKLAKEIAPDFASVNGALGSLRRHQARYADAVAVIQHALRFEENINTRYYLGLCQFLAGDGSGAKQTLSAIIDDPTLVRQGQVYGAYILGQVAEEQGDTDAARTWYTRMAEGAPKVIPALEDEWRRHKDSKYGDTLKDHVRRMQQIIARRPNEQIVEVRGAEISD
ncbi:MAG TPA: tetratricopeptide repeat protein [Aggregatilineaceae bacterium]|nr:tetratricopeptide repeat protein [Aggregatilineaceae bacterium]